MKTLKFTLILLTTIILASCTTTKIAYEEYVTRQADPVIINPYVTPTIADLDVSQTKETITETFDNDLTLKSKLDSRNVEAWKEIALANLMKKFDSDVIVAPTYNISTSDDMKNITVEVSGYPAKYTNFRNVNVADSSAMRVHGIEIARYTTTNYGNVKSIKSKTNKRNTEIVEKMSRLGTFFAPEIGVSNIIDGIDHMVLDIQGTYGKQINDLFGIGGGTGLFIDVWNEIFSIPLFVNARGYLSKSGVAPYYSVDFGFMLPIVNDKASYSGYSGHYYGDGNFSTKYVEKTYTKTSVKGLTFSPEIGIAFGKMNLGLEWKFWTVHTSKSFSYKELPSYITNDDINKFENFSNHSIKDRENLLFIKLGLVL